MLKIVRIIFLFLLVILGAIVGRNFGGGNIVIPVSFLALGVCFIIAEVILQRIKFIDLMILCFGVITGLVLGNLLFFAVFINSQFSTAPAIVVVNMFFAYLGGVIVIGKKSEIYKLLKLNHSSSTIQYILDTSVIIDGRIVDISRLKFLDGEFIVPKFILQELQSIADSSDSLKRTRGRNGLDVLNNLQKEKNLKVVIVENDYEDIKEVDTKLIQLAIDTGAKVFTNDYNLNKIAKLHKVVVLNLNDLSNSLKPVVLPGEEMEVTIIKDGKESGQGVAYLDDGTMIVVDNGRRRSGSKLKVTVTSVIQTSAGRMIFAKNENNGQRQS